MNIDKRSLFLQYSSASKEEIITRFNSSAQTGLTNEQVSEYQKKYGRNELPEKKVQFLDFMYMQYKSPIVVLLLVGSVTSLVLHEWMNAIIIISIVGVNAFIGAYQEYKATLSVKLLSKYLERSSKVIRQGATVIVKNAEIIPGDILVLEAGDAMPADVRFIESHNVLVDESNLSGESLPVQKTIESVTIASETVFQASNIGFSGTVVVEGMGKAIVFATGEKTVFGLEGKTVTATIHETDFFNTIQRISYFLIQMIVVTLIVLIVAQLMFRSPKDYGDLMMFVVALAVGIIPEALPTIITVALSRGALILSKNNVVVKRLAVIEDLGSLEVICTDKTGTITENVLTVGDVYAVGELNPVFYMSLSGAQPFTKEVRPTSPFDFAAWDTLSPTDFDLLTQYNRVQEVPFDTKYRRSLVLLQHGTQYILVVRGAHEEILSRAHLSEEKKADMVAWVKEQAHKGCRVMAVARKVSAQNINDLWSLESDLEFIGLIALYDPIKETVQYTLKKARKLGLAVKIITGDSPEIAGYIAYSIGLISDPKLVISGQDFAQLNAEDKKHTAETSSVFARFLSEQKAELIAVLKQNKTVAYLGDGINDILALHEAHVGIAVDSASDTVKDAADIILLKKSLKTIINGIVIGRQTFINTFNYLRITLALNIGNLYSIAAMSFFVPFLPLLPLQILLVNILADAPMIAIGTDNVDIKEIKKPTRYNLRQFMVPIIIFALLNSVFDFLFLYHFYGHSAIFFQTHWFIFNIVTETLYIFSGRTKLFFAYAVRPSWWLLLFVGITICIGILIPCTTWGRELFSFMPPTYDGLLWIAGLTLAYLMVCEVTKGILYMMQKGSKRSI
ncbi:MAG TPA: cation-transporting P-type ATPase [Candidatus Babeliales bacterium]|nr:cation-transporting P-type ATPase [Candidatus Babeliales bacterium]